MSNLIPEKRVNKNGVSVTKMVRSAPKSAVKASRVPAPSLGTVAAPHENKGAQQSFKPRPSQRREQIMDDSMAIAVVSPELQDRVIAAAGNPMFYNFRASEAELYDVFSVVSAGDAMALLQIGCKTAEEATAYLEENELTHLLKDNSYYAAEGLKRNLKSTEFFERFDGCPEDELASPYFMDWMEIRHMSSLQKEAGMIKDDVLRGEILLEDLKHVGASKFKSHQRMSYSRVALRRVRDADAKFTIDDLKWLVDTAIEKKVNDREYLVAADYLVNVGPEFLRGLENFNKLTVANGNHFAANDRYDRTLYELEFLAADAGKHRPLSAIIELYKAGIPADEAVRLTQEGLSPYEIIAVKNEGIGKAVVDGWL